MCVADVTYRFPWSLVLNSFGTMTPSRRASVFIGRVYSCVPWVKGVTPSAMASRFCAIRRSSPSSAARRLRNSIISRNFQPVSMCMTGKGIGAGAKALIARCSSTEESLPMLYSSTGFLNAAAVSR